MSKYLFTQKTRKLRQATFFFFLTKQGTLYFHMINIHTQGYITLNKYIIGIAIIGLPKVNLWATNTVCSEQKFTPQTNILHG